MGEHWITVVSLCVTVPILLLVPIYEINEYFHMKKMERMWKEQARQDNFDDEIPF